MQSKVASFFWSWYNKRVIDYQIRGEYITQMSQKKIFKISDDMDEMLKEASKMMEVPETSIFKTALILYLRQVLGDKYIK